MLHHIDKAGLVYGMILITSHHVANNDGENRSRVTLKALPLVTDPIPGKVDSGATGAVLWGPLWAYVHAHTPLHNNRSRRYSRWGRGSSLSVEDTVKNFHKNSRPSPDNRNMFHVHR